MADDEVGEALELLWGTAAVNTWNARRAALSWLGCCADHGYDGPAVPAWVKRMTPPDSETPARPKLAVDRLISRREVPLREKTLWRMLYETCARAEEILGVNIEDLDLPGRRAPGQGKGAAARRRGGRAREDFVLETDYWDAGTARLLPRLPKGRTRGPVFVTHCRPGPGKVVAVRGVCPDTGLARLSYGQARALLDQHTAVAGAPGTGWDLHEWRHSGLTHLGEQGVAADAHGQVPAPQGGEPPPLLQTLPRVDRRGHRTAGPRRRAALRGASAGSGALPQRVRAPGTTRKITSSSGS